MAATRRLTFEQSVRLAESIECPKENQGRDRAKLLEWGEKAVLDYWLLTQLLAGTVKAQAWPDGTTSFDPVPGKKPIEPKNWPPEAGKEKIEEPISGETSGLYSAAWSGDHRAACLSGQYMVAVNPEASTKHLKAVGAKS